MNYRNLLVSAVLATGVAGLATVSQADMVAADNGIAVEKSDVATPARGMTMTQVASKFGTPDHQGPSRGQAADLPVGISRLRGLFRARARDPQRRLGVGFPGTGDGRRARRRGITRTGGNRCSDELDRAIRVNS